MHCPNAPKKPRFVEIVPTVLIHGGASDEITEKAMIPTLKGIKRAARVGYDALKISGCVVEAVQEAVAYLEQNPNFNASYGSMLTSYGTIEMDACIMRGADLAAGCVSLVEDIAHPVRLARSVMDKSHHTYLAGEGAMKFAETQGFERLSPGSLVTLDAKRSLRKYEESLDEDEPGSDEAEFLFGALDSIGAVAIDKWGNMAAATSSGGLAGKLPGRIGSSPLLGAGIYADNQRGVVSATGHGETLLRYTVASRILAGMEYAALSPQDSTKRVLHVMKLRFKQPGGAVCFDTKGQMGIYFNTNYMPWAYQRGEYVHFGVKPGQDLAESTNVSPEDCNPCVPLLQQASYC